MSQTPAVIDSADPLSLATILPNPLADRVRSLPHALLIQDEITLTTLVDPTPQQTRVKLQFWEEYEAAVKQNRHLVLGNIIFGVCTREYLVEFVQSARNIAWLITPKPSYKLRIAELIDKGLDQIATIFDLPIPGANRKPLEEPPKPEDVVRIYRLKMDALKMLDMRKHGGYTQRTEARILQKNINETLPGAPDPDQPLNEDTVENLEYKMRKLEKRIEAGRNQNGSLLNQDPSDEPILVVPRLVDQDE